MILGAFGASLTALALCGGDVAAQSPGRVYRVAHAVPTHFSGKPGPFFDSFRERLNDKGFVQGRNLDLRFFTQRASGPKDDPLQPQQVIDEVLAWRPDVILVGNVGSVRLFQKARTTLPLVFANIQDPQSHGIVANLSRPGANITGAGVYYDGLTIKRLEVTKELLPSARIIVVVFSRGGGQDIPHESRKAMRAAALRLKVTLMEVDAAGIDGGLCEIAKRARESRADAILTWGNILPPPDYSSDKPWGAEGYGDCLAKLQREAGIPVIDDSLDTVRQGCALAVGEDQNDSYRRAADVVARILAGAKPANVPVDMQMRLQLHVNLRSLRELGLKLPQSLQARAERIFE